MSGLRWVGDQNNPNRDLSDPNWISREGAHAESMARRERRSSYVEKLVPEPKRMYIMIWQRLMNSGITVMDKPHTLSYMKRLAYKKEFVKTTIIEGKVVAEFEERG